jgi:hypothetical protein
LVSAIDVSIVSSEVVEMEHAFGDAVFTKRGEFTLNLGTDGKRTISDVEKVSIKGNAAKGFKNLLNDNSLYSLRFHKVGASADEYTYISIPACALQTSGLKEDILLFLGNDGNIVGANYQSPVIGLPRPCDSSLLSDTIVFLTRIKIGDAQESMVIPVQATGPKPASLQHVNIAVKDESGKVVSEQSQQPQQSFMRRYWYLFVGGALYVMLSPSEAPAKGTKAKTS